MSTKNLPERVKDTLRAHFSGQTDANGYVSQWQENLLPSVQATQFQADLQSGAGHELDEKFRALHSSSALAVNTFAPFKTHPRALPLWGRYDLLRFEKQLRTGLAGYAPHLDVWLEGESEVIAIESKFLEYMTPKAPEFSAKYTQAALPQMDAQWWNALQNAQNQDKQFLDTAQLVKHALGVLNFQVQSSTLKATLLYLFWEPVNAAAFETCYLHRQQIEKFASTVAGSSLQFVAMSYNELWSQWQHDPHLALHLSYLRARYEFAV